MELLTETFCCSGLKEFGDDDTATRGGLMGLAKTINFLCPKGGGNPLGKPFL